MAWQQIKVNVQAKDADAYGDYLEELGAQAVTFVDAKDTPMYEPKPGEVMLWPDTQVIGLFDASEDIGTLLEQLKHLIKAGGHSARINEIVVDQLEDKDWEREWMDNFHPMKFGERVWICPSWTQVPDPSAVNIMLDPGLAFGTGTHPTTSLCLQWLDGLDLKGKTVIDFGCGSGILAIAALKLGASRAIGIDIDPQALLASKGNATRNKVENQLELYLPENAPDLKADIVVANILAGPLKSLHEVITALCKEQALLAMSGILAEQSEAVKSVYIPKFHFSDDKQEGEWVRLSAKLKN